MHALVEQLVAAEFEVDILYCPYDGPAALWPLWHDYWANRGAKLHYMPRRAGEGAKRRYLSQAAFLGGDHRLSG